MSFRVLVFRDGSHAMQIRCVRNNPDLHLITEEIRIERDRKPSCFPKASGNVALRCETTGSDVRTLTNGAQVNYINI